MPLKIKFYKLTINFWDKQSKKGYDQAIKISDVLAERVILTNRFAMVISLFTTFYTFMYYFLQQWTTSIAGIVATLCMWTVIGLNAHSKFWFSRYLVVTASVWVVLISDITFKFQSLVDFYYLPCMLMAFLLFHYKETKSLISLSILPLLVWLVPRWLQLSVPDLNTELDPFYLLLFKYTNPIGSFIITAYFAYLFVYSITEYEKKISIANRFSVIDEMSASVVHEINNPLSIIVFKSQLIQKSLTQPSVDFQKVQSNLSAIDSSIFRIQKIINGLKIMARSSENESLTATNSESILADVIEMTEDKLTSEGIKITINHPSLIELHCRAYQIVQIIVNLINNSKDAIRELQEKWIQIDIIAKKDTVQFIIQDSGVGIPLEVSQRIMEPLFTTKPKGTGLGLHLSKKIAEQHGGSLKLDTDRKHTCFVLELPTKLS
jgi:signal transduction histidine kinase